MRLELRSTEKQKKGINSCIKPSEQTQGGKKKHTHNIMSNHALQNGEGGDTSNGHYCRYYRELSRKGNILVMIFSPVSASDQPVKDSVEIRFFFCTDAITADFTSCYRFETHHFDQIIDG